MHDETYSRLANQAAETAVEVAWTQWAALGSMASSRKRATSIVDPEALTLLSLTLTDRERRLGDLLQWWAEKAASLLSVQRIKNQANAYPDPVHHRLADFAALAVEAGDRRWKSLTRDEPEGQGITNSEESPNIELIEPSAVMLRLRTGFGVGAKADVLSFLLGVRGAWANVQAIATATSYSPRSIKRAADEMAAARLIRASTNIPTEYHADVSAWKQLLEVGKQFPKWVFWHPLFAFLATVIEWASTVPPTTSPYLASSRSRDLMEEHWQAFKWNQISVPDPARFPGTAYREAFADSVATANRWLLEHV